jgi:hypothetical protein
MSELDVTKEMIIQRRVGELGCGFWDVMSGGFYRNIIVLLEVDTSLLLGWVVNDAKEFTLQAGVGRTRNVLAVTPLTITTATVRCDTASASSRVAIGIRVEGRSLIPAATCR